MTYMLTFESCIIKENNKIILKEEEKYWYPAWLLMSVGVGGGMGAATFGSFIGGIVIMVWTGLTLGFENTIGTVRVIC